MTFLWRRITNFSVCASHDLPQYLSKVKHDDVAAQQYSKLADGVEEEQSHGLFFSNPSPAIRSPRAMTESLQEVSSCQLVSISST